MEVLCMIIYCRKPSSYTNAPDVECKETLGITLCIKPQEQSVHVLSQPCVASAITIMVNKHKMDEGNFNSSTLTLCHSRNEAISPSTINCIHDQCFTTLQENSRDHQGSDESSLKLKHAIS
jgi:hypothetical protein